MTDIIELVIVIIAVSVAVAYIVFTLFLPVIRKNSKKNEPGCSDQCGCEAKDKISELTKGKV